jgi:hypothetical protein
MVARVSRLVMDPERIDSWLAIVPNIGARLRTQAGFVSLSSYVNRETGECIGISVWADAQAEKGSRALAALSRDSLAQASGVQNQATVEIFEISHHIT